MKVETQAGTICGIVISVVAIQYVQHAGLVSVGYFAPCDSKDILLMGGSVVLILYKKIFFPRNKNERNIKNER